MKNTITLPNGEQIAYAEDIDIEVVSKVARLPYPKLRNIVLSGGVKFSKTPDRHNLIMVLDEIDQKELKRLYLENK